ncbi:MAG: DUF3792 family protein [Traorella sp.]
MKKNLRSLFYTCLCAFLLTILVSFILSILYFFQLFFSYLSIFSKVLGFFVFIICGFLLGKNIKEKTFFYALALAIIIFLLSLLLHPTLISSILMVLKCILFIVVSLISRNT